MVTEAALPCDRQNASIELYRTPPNTMGRGGAQLWGAHTLAPVPESTARGMQLALDRGDKPRVLSSCKCHTPMQLDAALPQLLRPSAIRKQSQCIAIGSCKSTAAAPIYVSIVHRDVSRCTSDLSY